MTRATHYTAAALLCAASVAQATGPAPGTTDPEVVRWIVGDMVADDRSALTLNGEGVRFIDQPGGGGIVTPAPVPLPGAIWMTLAALGRMAMIGRIRK